MRLSKFTDYAFRLLIMAANNDRRLTIHEARHKLDIPEGHLKKIIRTLSGAGYLKSVRGRGGGFSSGKPATSPTIGKTRGGRLYSSMISSA